MKIRALSLNLMTLGESVPARALALARLVGLNTKPSFYVILSFEFVSFLRRKY
jgi:hypothetical protein